MNQNFIIIMNQKCQIYSIKIYIGKKTPNLQQNLREEKKHQIYNKIYMRNREKNMPNLQYQYLHEKKTPNLQHQNLREENKNAKFTTSKFACEKKRQIYNIKIYVRKKKNAKFTTSKFTWEKRNAKFTTWKFTWEKKTPNLQHENLREKKKGHIKNIKIYVWKKKRQIYNIKIYVRKKTPNLKHQNLRGKKNEKFTTSLTISRTTLNVCHNTNRGRYPNQCIYIFSKYYSTKFNMLTFGRKYFCAIDNRIFWIISKQFFDFVEAMFGMIFGDILIYILIL